MSECYAYIRVSTAKQGEKGVSLQEQRASIERYAEQNRLAIIEWFEERETAAKRGRRQFGRMLSLLKRRKAAGVIIHKIDRSARNLKDWADLGELIDQGIAVHFANESLDLASRGGRLSADIQAVVAADYIRNLREEARKGFYGRLKQGILPLMAPIGYLDQGSGKAKTLDPERAPLVREAFELYATGEYNLRSLAKELDRRGLRNRRGGRITRTGVSTILNNPFYTGVIRVKKTGEVFEGVHPPLVSGRLFDQVQAILTGKTNTKVVQHNLLFRKRVDCALCGRRLIGERQKGYAYYRCHTKSCPMRCTRQELIEKAVAAAIDRLALDHDDYDYLVSRVGDMKRDWLKESKTAREELKLRLGKVEGRLTRLTDAFLDGSIDKETFEARKTTLFRTKRELADAKERAAEEPAQKAQKLLVLLELVNTAPVSWQVGKTDERRGLLQELTSNRTVSPNGASVELRFPYILFANRENLLCSGQEPIMDRTPGVNLPREAKRKAERRRTEEMLDKLLEKLRCWMVSGLEPEEPCSTP